jgi:hypothetical protein
MVAGGWQPLLMDPAEPITAVAPREPFTREEITVLLSIFKDYK